MKPSPCDRNSYSILKIIGIYVLFGGLWIYFSDIVLGWFVRDPVLMTRIAMSKGVLFVAFTAVVLYALLNRYSQQLRASQVQLSNAMDLARIVYWEADPADNVFVFNDAFYAFYGTTAKQEGGYRMAREEYVQRFIHPDDLQLVGRFMEQNVAITGNEFSSDLEHRIIRRDGEVRYIAARISVVKDNSGRIIKKYGANQDVTDRVKMEEALRHSEERHRMLAENTSDIIWMRDVHSDKFIYMSPSVFCLTGYTVEECLELPWERLFTPASLAITKGNVGKTSEFMSSTQRTENHLLELEIICKDGSTRWLETAIERVCDTAGNTVTIQGIGRDITKRKALEDKLQAISITDELTGLYNRRGFFLLSLRQLKLAKRSGKNAILLFADLDKLKWINDTIGHQEGDMALLETARVLKDTFRETDIISRMGGDEFAILAVDINDNAAKILIDRLQTSFDARNTRETRKYMLSLSIGVAQYDSQNPESLDALISRADMLMYEEKRNKKR